MFLFQIQEPCITTALDCVRRELDGTVREECNHTEASLNQAVDFLDWKIHSNKSHVSIPPHCVAKSSANDKNRKNNVTGT